VNEQEIAEGLIHFALEPTVAVGIAATTPTDDPDSFRSASGTLIRLSGVPVLVTNWHVVEAYRKFAAQRETQFFFADTAIDPVERLHSESQELDLAVLLAYRLRIRADRNAPAGVPHIRVYEPTQWPPAPPQPGDSVFFAGWPEVGRSVDFANMEATFQPYAYVGATIQEATADKFTIQFDRARFWGVTGLETQEQLEERQLSGLSGGPIFRDMSASGRMHELVGFITEYGVNWDLLIATSALNIRPDGRIDRSRPAEWCKNDSRRVGRLSR
jgi:hypothetical protein